MPQISVIVPAYNCESFLEKAIDSVLRQKDADLEVIIVDDGSTDNTPTVCRKLCEKDGRIRVVTQENAGVSEARNRGISEACGKYIAFVDADDWLEDDSYGKMLRAIEETGAECAMCGHYRTWPDGTREVDPAPFENGFNAHDSVMNKLVLPLLCDRLSADIVLGTIWRYLFLRQRIVDMDIKFSGAYLEDEIFLIEYFAMPTTLACVNEPLYNYLQNPASVTHRYFTNYADTFRASIASKRRLVEKFRIAAPEYWVHNTAWAGLLIAVSNEFAPGNNSSIFKKARKLREIAAGEDYAEAIAKYSPEGMNRNKTIVAKLMRAKLYFPLALLYTYKNRNRN